MQKPKLLLLTSLSFLAYVLNAAKDERPNILFIFTDDHALNALSAYGGPLAKLAPTPHLDRIAKEACSSGIA